ncbi:MAG: DUF488 family protein [Thermoplasmata archaeon]
MEIKIQRIYDKEIPNGFKILVDGLWPRGVKKESVDYWAKKIAPSRELREWYSHDPKKWEIFLERYKNELIKNNDLQNFVSLIKEKLEKMDVIFLYATKEREKNNAVALKKILKELFPIL